MTHTAARIANSSTSTPAATSASFEAELTMHRKILVQLLVFGAIALGLAPFGEHSLTRSSPIFAYLGLTYGAWQVGYVFGLTVLAIAWLAALAQRLSVMAECRALLQRRLRYEADVEARAQRRRASKEAPPAVPAKRSTAASNKFDY